MKTNLAIGHHGVALIERLAADGHNPVQILTHCNAGALATLGWGTATAPMYVAHDSNVVVSSANNDWDNPDAPSLVWLENNGRMQFSKHRIAASPTHLGTLFAGDLDGLFAALDRGLATPEHAAFVARLAG